VSAESFDRRGAAADTVAGLLSALAVFFAAIGVVWHPLRLIPISILTALVASAMARENGRFAFTAFLICAACFFTGMTVAVLAQRPLW
jgi:hypothetical protein